MKRLMVLCVWMAGLATACSEPMQRVDPDQDDSIGGTGIDSADVRASADDMARSLLGMPRVFAKGTPYIVMSGIENRTRFQIDDAIITERMLTQLLESGGDRVRFIDREHYEKLQQERQMKRSGAVSVPTDASGKPDLVAAPLGTDFFLFGKLQSISKDAGGAVSDYIQATFRLTDAESSEIVWSHTYDWKKVGKAGVIYR